VVNSSVADVLDAPLAQVAAHVSCIYVLSVQYVILRKNSKGGQNKSHDFYVTGISISSPNNMDLIFIVNNNVGRLFPRGEGGGYGGNRGYGRSKK
jgi:hypothetical protein